MQIRGICDYEKDEKGYYREIIGEIFISINDFFEYLRDNILKNIVLISWLPNIKSIWIDRDRLDIRFHTGEFVELYDKDVADYLIECIEKEFEEKSNNNV